AVAASLLILVIGVAALTLYVLIETGLLARWAAALAERQRAREEEVAEPGALPPPAPGAAPAPIAPPCANAWSPRANARARRASGTRACHSPAPRGYGPRGHDGGGGPPRAAAGCPALRDRCV